MNYKSKTNSYIEFFYKAFRNILLVSIPLTIISALILGFSVSHSSATVSNSGTDQIQFYLSTSCTMSSVVNDAHIKEISNGTYHSNVGKTTVTTLCNDGNGYSIYANGFSNNEEDNNKLINSEHPEFSIDTGLNTNGSTSAWAMKLNNVENDPTPPTIETSYNNTYGLVPSYWTKVASKASGTTDMDEGSSFTTTYAIYTTSNQHSGTYNGQVKYILTHPNSTAQALFMQNVAEWKDSVLRNVGDSIQATDQRDGKSYWVTRLADGNVWMTQNLAIDLSYISDNNIVMRTFTSNDTDLNVFYDSETGSYAEYSSDGYIYDDIDNIIYWTPTSSAQIRTIDDRNNVPGWADSYIYPYSAKKPATLNNSHESLGNFYNWTAAIASDDSSLLTQDTLNDISINPKNSICPKGWRLPTVSDDVASNIGSTNEFARLNLLYNNGQTSGTNSGVKLTEAPLWLIFSGRVAGRNYQPDGGGNYWSSTTKSSNLAYFLLTTTNNVYTNYAGYGGFDRSHGRSVRCVAR